MLFRVLLSILAAVCPRVLGSDVDISSIDSTSIEVIPVSTTSSFSIDPTSIEVIPVPHTTSFSIDSTSIEVIPVPHTTSTSSASDLTTTDNNSDSGDSISTTTITVSNSAVVTVVLTTTTTPPVSSNYSLPQSTSSSQGDLEGSSSDDDDSTSTTTTTISNSTVVTAVLTATVTPSPSSNYSLPLNTSSFPEGTVVSNATGTAALPTATASDMDTSGGSSNSTAAITDSDNFGPVITTTIEETIPLTTLFATITDVITMTLNDTNLNEGNASLVARSRVAVPPSSSVAPTTSSSAASPRLAPSSWRRIFPSPSLFPSLFLSAIALASLTYLSFLLPSVLGLGLPLLAYFPAPARAVGIGFTSTSQSSTKCWTADTELISEALPEQYLALATDCLRIEQSETDNWGVYRTSGFGGVIGGDDGNGQERNNEGGFLTIRSEKGCHFAVQHVVGSGFVSDVFATAEGFDLDWAEANAAREFIAAVKTHQPVRTVPSTWSTCNNFELGFRNEDIQISGVDVHSVLVQGENVFKAGVFDPALCIDHEVTTVNKLTTARIARLLNALIVARQPPSLLSSYADVLLFPRVTQATASDEDKAPSDPVNDAALDAMAIVVKAVNPQGPIPIQPDRIQNLQRKMLQTGNFENQYTAPSTQYLKSQLEKAEELPELESIRQERLQLPMHQHATKVLSLVKDNVFSICESATPFPVNLAIILDDAIHSGDGASCNIYCEQPHEFEATSAAKRVAFERGERPGSTVGYDVSHKMQPPQLSGSILYCTNETLLQRFRHSPDVVMGRASHLILDEAHERSATLGLLLGTLKTLMMDRAQRVVLMGTGSICSSLYDHRSQYFQNMLAPTYYERTGKNPKSKMNNNPGPKEASGDLEKVATADQGEFVMEDSSEEHLEHQNSIVHDGLAIATIAHIAKTTTDDSTILVFLPSFIEITSVDRGLQELRPFGLDFGDELRFSIIGLHSSLPESQFKVFAPVPTGCRKDKSTATLRIGGVGMNKNSTSEELVYALWVAAFPHKIAYQSAGTDFFRHDDPWERPSSRQRKIKMSPHSLNHTFFKNPHLTSQFVAFTKIRGSEHLYETSRISPLTALLFGGHLAPPSAASDEKDDPLTTLILNDWLRLGVKSAKHQQMLLDFQQSFNEIVNRSCLNLLRLMSKDDICELFPATVGL
ncbi:hypothetical protein F5Y16DRAFT_422250 [Xylariaceae sp. FL0255]|nr:hypothetical protein F5Y16DRAFT_422250 [Xylariaceae sp. FL0255]